MTTIIDAKECVLGRTASQIAERLLKGETIVVINAEQSIINGTKETILQRYKTRINLRAKGNPYKGPKFPKKRPDMIFRQAVKGMLPNDSKRGKNALRKCKVFIGTPTEYKEQEFEKIKGTKMQERKTFITLEQLSNVL